MRRMDAFGWGLAVEIAVAFAAMIAMDVLG